MKLLRTEEPAAELELLIKEARARARRRRLRRALVLVVLAGLLVVGLMWINLSPDRGVSSGKRDARPVGSRRPAAWPRFFVDTESGGEGNSALEVRQSTTGRRLEWLAAPHDALPQVLAVAAVGPDSFVVALQKVSPLRPQGTGCATQLYDLRLNAQGHVRSLTPLGPALPGYVYALTASAGGRDIGYAMQGSPCAKGAPGYLGVLDTVSGQRRQWSDVGMMGVAVGNVALSGGLSMTADGSELVFAATVSPPYGEIRAYEVRMLPTDAAAGTVSARSRILLRHPGRLLAYGAAVITPDGRSLYLCSDGGTTAADSSSRLVVYRIAAMKPSRTLATFNGSQAGCAAATLDPSGRWLLVPYGLTVPRRSGVGHIAWGGRGKLHIARINTATGARSNLSAWTQPDFGSMAPTTGIEAAW